MKKCLIVDFNDSFTYNIASSFLEVKVISQVINWIDFLEFFQKGDTTSFKNFDFLVLGPGPGNPNEYWELGKQLGKIKKPIIGICLGHQIIGKYFGAKIVKTAPIHGRAVKVNLPNWKVFNELRTKLGNSILVQKYNSLKIENNKTGSIKGMNEDFIFRQNFLSMQFHPESIGTEESKIIFEWMKNWTEFREK